jgi:ribosomal protein L3
MGAKQHAVMNLEVVQIEKNAPVIFVKGSVPGHAGSFLFISKA